MLIIKNAFGLVSPVSSKNEDSSKYLTKKERFNALSLNIKKIKKNFSANISPIRNKNLSNFASLKKKAKIELDPSIERSLEQMNNLESLSRNKNVSR